jgi:subtilisin family serine protease/subtilisin-like proprotein convertase family protein
MCRARAAAFRSRLCAIVQALTRELQPQQLRTQRATLRIAARSHPGRVGLLPPHGVHGGLKRACRGFRENKTMQAPSRKSGSGSPWLRAALLLGSVGWGCGRSEELVPDRSSTNSAALVDHAHGYMKDSVIVRFRAAPTAPFARTLATRVKGAIEDRNDDGIDDRLEHIANGKLAVVRLGDQVDVATALDELRKDPTVLYAEPNYVLRAAAVPNDARFSELYGLNNTGQTGGTPDADIDAPEAWSRTVGSSKVVIGVIDTGVDYRHEDLAANMWVNPREIPDNGIDDDGNGVIDDVHGFDATTGSGDPFDDNHHGTHTAGTIGAVGNNGIGVVGVNWHTQIMALKFLNYDGWGTTADAIRAIDYAVAQKRAGVNLRVLSSSWGGDGFSQALLDAILSAGEADILFVAAAGNSAGDTDAFPYYPSAYEAPNLVSVAATDQADRLASFSNFGATTVDLGAPGTNILSTVPNNDYQFLDGTSMATPHVAGVAALALSINDTLTVDELKQLLLTSGDPIPALNGITFSGRRLDAASAVAQAGRPVSRFATSAVPSRRVISQGSTAAYSIDVRSVLGFSGRVALTVSSEPSIDAALSITPVVTAPGIAGLTVATSPHTARGSYKLTITGRSGALVASRTVALRILAPGTLFELNATPVSQVTQQTFGATVQVALQGVGDFQGPIGLSVSSQPPFPGTAYFEPGAVAAPGTSTLHVDSDCTTPPGDYAFTIVGTAEGATASATVTVKLDRFGTFAMTAPSLDTPMAIPDASPAGITSAIEIAEDVPIQDLSVTVNITHTRIGDLVVQLIGPDGRSVSLHDRAGGDGDDLHQTYVVRDFTGVSSNGAWRLQVSDRATREVGNLDSWQMDLGWHPDSFPPFANFEFSVDGMTVDFLDTSFGTGCGGGAPIVSRSWDFDDGATATGPSTNVRHTYAAPGDHVVTLTVTDSSGLTGSMQQAITVTRPPPVLSIVRVVRDRTHHTIQVDLHWCGAMGNRVELYRNLALVSRPWNDGNDRDVFRGQDTAYRWHICEPAGLCSNEVSVDLGRNLAGDQATMTTEIGGKPIVETITVADER